MEKDSHGKLHEAFAAEMLNKWEAVEEEWDTKMTALDLEMDSDEEVKEYKAKLIEKMAPYDTAEFKISDFMEKNFPVDEESETEEEQFEEKSMFDPTEKQGKWIGIMQKPSETRVRFDEKLDDENNVEIGELGFGSKDLHKKSNENLYNIQHN